MSSAPNPQSDADQLEAASDQAITACHEAVKALIVANHYLETDLEKLKAAASMATHGESSLRRPGRCRVIGRIGMIKGPSVPATKASCSGMSHMVKNELSN
jgi:hypothetical protein